MFNHFRTLLLNRAASATSYVGDELVPAGFRPVSPLPAAVSAARSYLFGAAPDPYMLNYRLRQLLAVVHAGPLAAAATDLDPRITYAIETADFVPPSLYAPRVSRTGGAASDTLRVSGTPGAPDRSGRMYHAFRVAMSGEGTAIVDRDAPRPGKWFYDSPLLAGGVSAPIPLAGSGYSFSVDTENPGASWFVEVLNRPQFDLGQIAAALGRLGEPTLDALFGVDAAEPYLTFRNLWHGQGETPLRLAAIVSAVAYRTEEARAGNA